MGWRAESSVDVSPTSPDQLLDILSVAEWLATSVRHVRRLVSEKRIPYVKVGHLIRFEHEDVQRWIKMHKIGVVPSNGEKRLPSS